MKRSIATLLLVALAAGCAAPVRANHWNRTHDAVRSIQYHTLGWDSTDGQSYRDYAFEKEVALSKTLQRHFFMHNPDNPWLQDPEDYDQPTEEGFIFERPVSSLILIGDEVFEVFESGGPKRFVTQWSPVWHDEEPVPPSEFELENR